MRDFARYLFASAGLEVTDDLLASLEKSAMEAAPAMGVHPRVILEAEVQAIIACEVAEQFKSSIEHLQMTAGHALECFDELNKSVLNMAKPRAHRKRRSRRRMLAYARQKARLKR